MRRMICLCATFALAAAGVSFGADDGKAGRDAARNTLKEIHRQRKDLLSKRDSLLKQEAQRQKQIAAAQAKAAAQEVIVQNYAAISKKVSARLDQLKSAINSGNVNPQVAAIEAAELTQSQAKLQESLLAAGKEYAAASASLSSLLQARQVDLVEYRRITKLSDQLRDEWLRAAGVTAALVQPDKTLVTRLTEWVVLDPEFAPAYFLRGTAAFVSNDLTQAAKDIDKAIQLEPAFADAIAIKAVISDRLGNRADADKLLSRARKLGSVNPTVHVCGSIVYSNRGNERSAVAAMRRATEVAPKEPAYRCILAEKLARCPDLKVRDTKAAIAEAKRACAQAREGSISELTTLATCQELDADYPSAVATLKRAMPLASGEPLEALRKRIADLESRVAGTGK